MAKTQEQLTTEQEQRELDATAATLPIRLLVEELFTDPKMFETYARFEKEGFSLVEHAPHKIMTGSHKKARGYVFKKYNDDKPCKKQLRNYMHRLEGARLLSAFISAHGFSRVVVPRKWLYALPSSFPARYLVVAEKVDLAARDATERAYARIGKEQLEELATILYYFRGLNSTAQNLPYTEDGRIAFIDTERWHHSKEFLRKVGDRLPGSRRKQAEAVFKALSKRGERPFRATFK